MLYLALSPISNPSQNTSAAIFIRNSGTENKIGINLRGRKKDSRKLKFLGELILRILIKTMKDFTNPWAQDERYLLNLLTVERGFESKTKIPSERYQRLFNEIKKQRLIEPTSSGYCLTQLGKWVTIHWLGGVSESGQVSKLSGNRH